MIGGPNGSDAGSGGVLGRLKSLLESPPAPRPPEPERPAADLLERCELCGVPIPPEHRHLVNLETRSLLCACRPCGLLFSQAGAGRFRTVPERYLAIPDLALTAAQWESFEIPVGIAFFFHNSTLGRSAAFYPSPVGATESLLSLAAWEELVRANPLLTGLEPDVEALLVRRRDAGFGDFECFIVPIDACYELVGRIRRLWKGFQGGTEVWSEIEAFFGGLRERSGGL